MRIRAATAADAGAIAGIYRPYVTDSAVSFELEPPDAAEVVKRIEAVTRQLPWLVCDVGGEVAGYAYASKHRDRAAYQWSVEVSAYTHPAHRRSGVARVLYGQLFRVLRLQGFYNAYAGITLPNEASEGFHHALGFELVGVYRRIGFKHGVWHDVAWYALDLQDHDAPEHAPIAFRASMAE